MQGTALAGACRTIDAERFRGDRIITVSRLRSAATRRSEYRAVLPERLRMAVLRALRSVEEPRELPFLAGGAPLDVHHVVAAGLERAGSSRLMLRAWSVDIHSVANAAILPRSFHQGRGLHKGCYLDSVNRQIMLADGAARRVAIKAGDSEGRRVFIDMLQKLGDSIVAGAADPVATSLQRILRSSEREMWDRRPILDE